MDTCFTHKDVEAVATCAYCAKRYCADCLLLHGPRQVVICRHCYDVISGQLRRWLSWRKALAAAGIIFGAILLIWGVATLFSDRVCGTYYVIVAFLCLAVASRGIVRLRRIHEFLPVRPYHEDQDAGV